MRPPNHIKPDEFKALSKTMHRDLNLITRFYYECIKVNQNGILKKPTPRTLLNFLKNHHKHESDTQNKD